MRRAIGWGAAFGGLSFVMLDALVTRLGFAPWIPRAVAAEPWMASRAAGFTAYVALSLEVALGLLVSTGALDRLLARARIVELHQWLSSATLLLVAAHALVLLGDGFAGLDALDLTIPFLAPVARLPTALSVLSAWILVGLHASYAMRGRLGARTWRKLHYASFGLYALATIHGIAAGTDVARPWAITIDAGSGLVVGALLIARIRQSMARATVLQSR